jgi:hypothetical protein
MGPIGIPETSVLNQFMPRNNREDKLIHLLYFFFSSVWVKYFLGARNEVVESKDAESLRICKKTLPSKQSPILQSWKIFAESVESCWLLLWNQRFLRHHNHNWSFNSDLRKVRTIYNFLIKNKIILPFIATQKLVYNVYIILSRDSSFRACNSIEEFWHL